MSYADEEVVWKRSMNGGECEDVWDDRALVEAYDRAVKLVNRRIADKSGDDKRDDKLEDTSGNRSAAKGKAHSWQTGEYCRTTYSEDGIEYEARIISIDASNETCFVKFVGYGNEEHKPLNHLKPSFGKRWRRQQQSTDAPEVNSNSDTDYETKSFTNQMRVNEQNQNSNKTHSSTRVNASTSSWFMPSETMPSSPPIIPPPITMRANSGLPSDDESLASMLMSWYMSGYHTGYYTALRQSRQQCRPDTQTKTSMNK